MRNDIFYEEKVWITTLFFFRKKERHPSYKAKAQMIESYWQTQFGNLRFWAKQNPPDGCRVILAGIAKPKSKSASGTEDFVLTLRVEET